MRCSYPQLGDKPLSDYNEVPHIKPGLCQWEAILVNHLSAYKKCSLWMDLQMPGPKAEPQLYTHDVSHSPTTQLEGPTVRSQPFSPLLTSDQPHIFSQSLHCMRFMFTCLQEIQLFWAVMSNEPWKISNVSKSGNNVWWLTWPIQFTSINETWYRYEDHLRLSHCLLADRKADFMRNFHSQVSSKCSADELMTFKINWKQKPDFWRLQRKDRSETQNTRTHKKFLNLNKKCFAVTLKVPSLRLNSMQKCICSEGIPQPLLFNFLTIKLRANSPVYMILTDNLNTRLEEARSCLV